MRRLYYGILDRMEREYGTKMDEQIVDTKKVVLTSNFRESLLFSQLTMFRHLGETLCGGGGQQDNNELVESRLQLGSSPSPTPSSVGSSSASTLGVIFGGQQQRRKTTMEVLREGVNE